MRDFFKLFFNRHQHVDNHPFFLGKVLEKRGYVFLFSVFFTYSFPSWCDPVVADTPAHQLVQAIGAIAQYNALFRQERIVPQKEEYERTQGTFLYARPDKFRWSVKAPAEELFVSNGKQVWHYEPDLEQVTLRKFQLTDDMGPIGLLSRDPKKWIKNYTVELIKQKNRRIFSLKPRDVASHIRAISLHFIQAVGNLQLTGMDIEDALGQSIHIVFSNIKQNQQIDEHAFQFKPPVGVDIVAAS